MIGLPIVKIPGGFLWAALPEIPRVENAFIIISWTILGDKEVDVGSAEINALATEAVSDEDASAW